MTICFRASNVLYIIVDFGQVVSTKENNVKKIVFKTKKQLKMSQGYESKLYHTYFTRNKDRTRVCIDWQKNPQLSHEKKKISSLYSIVTIFIFF